VGAVRSEIITRHRLWTVHECPLGGDPGADGHQGEAGYYHPQDLTGIHRAKDPSAEEGRALEALVEQGSGPGCQCPRNTPGSQSSGTQGLSGLSVPFWLISPPVTGFRLLEDCVSVCICILVCWRVHPRVLDCACVRVWAHVCAGVCILIAGMLCLEGRLCRLLVLICTPPLLSSHRPWG
jgi:hypothetical protein